MPPSEFIDDISIGPNEILWRRVHPDHVNPGNNAGEWEPSSAAFRDIQMSVYIALEASEENVLLQFPDHSIVAFTAEVARLGGECIIVRDPLPGNLSHTLVCRTDDPTRRITGSQATRIKKQTTWVVIRQPG